MSKTDQNGGLKAVHEQLAARKEPVTWIRVGRLLTGRLEEPLNHAHLLFDGENILYSGVEPPPDKLMPGERTTPDLELPDYTVLPGLIEAHAHLFLEGGEINFEKRSAHLKKTPEALLTEAVPRLENLVRTGVTAVRDAGDKDGVGLALSRRRKSEPEWRAAYLDSPGAAVHKTGRYGSFMGDAISDEGDLRAAVRQRVEAGADRIKLIPTGIINFKKGAVTAQPQLSLDELTVLRDEARKHNRRTFAHASGTTGIGYAIGAGVDSIEHGFFMSDEQLGRLVEQRLAWVPTFSPVQKQLEYAETFGWDTVIQDHLKRILEGHSRLLTRAVEMGANVVAGSDAGSCAVAHGTGLLEELVLMEQAGMSALEVIHSATGRSEAIIGYQEPIGVLERGYRSSFILLENDPSAGVSALQGDRIVHHKGSFYHTRNDEQIPGL